MPGLESNLIILFAVLLFLTVAGLAARALWRPYLRRVWMYFVAWWERDARAEQEAKLLKRAREQAESEMRACMHEAEDDSSCPDTATLPNLSEAKPVREVLSDESKQTLRN